MKEKETMRKVYTCIVDAKLFCRFISDNSQKKEWTYKRWMEPYTMTHKLKSKSWTMLSVCHHKEEYLQIRNCEEYQYSSSLDNDWYEWGKENYGKLW